MKSNHVKSNSAILKIKEKPLIFSATQQGYALKEFKLKLKLLIYENEDLRNQRKKNSESLKYWKNFLNEIGKTDFKQLLIKMKECLKNDNTDLKLQLEKLEKIIHLNQEEKLKFCQKIEEKNSEKDETVKSQILEFELQNKYHSQESEIMNLQIMLQALRNKNSTYFEYFDIEDNVISSIHDNVMVAMRGDVARQTRLLNLETNKKNKNVNLIQNLNKEIQDIKNNFVGNTATTSSTSKNYQSNPSFNKPIIKKTNTKKEKKQKGKKGIIEELEVKLKENQQSMQEIYEYNKNVEIDNEKLFQESDIIGKQLSLAISKIYNLEISLDRLKAKTTKKQN